MNENAERNPTYSLITVGQMHRLFCRKCVEGLEAQTHISARTNAALAGKVEECFNAYLDAGGEPPEPKTMDLKSAVLIRGAVEFALMQAAPGQGQDVMEALKKFVDDFNLS